MCTFQLKNKYILYANSLFLLFSCNIRILNQKEKIISKNKSLNKYKVNFENKKKMY